MKTFKFWALTLITSAMIFFVGYMTMKTIDERLQARYPETETTECTTEISLVETEISLVETEISLVEFEEIPDEPTKESDTILDESADEEVPESSTEIQPIVEEVSSIPADTYVEPVTETDTEPVATYDAEIAALAQTLWGECQGCSKTEQAAVIWCVLNRVDDPTFPNSIYAVVSAPYQFQGYSPYNPIDADLYAISEDVVGRWYAEKNSAVDVGRVLPKEYCFFEGDGYHNHFVTSWKGSDFWTWTLPSPYEN